MEVMAKPKKKLRLGMIGVLLAVLTGVAVFVASAATLDWAWVTTAALQPPGRTGHIAIPIPLSGGGSGVLVVGGWYQKDKFSIEPVANSYMYRVDQRIWAPVPDLSLKLPRTANTATLLPSGTATGQVLVAGGYITGADGKSNSIANCEILGQANPSGDLKVARDTHTATLLSDDPSSPHYGKVLVAGGLQHVNGEFTLLNSSELYAGGNSSYIHGAQLEESRWLATATRLPNGKVLMVGGVKKDTTTLPQTGPTFPIYTAIGSCALYDPDTESWGSGPALNHPRAMHTATLLSDDPSSPYYGQVLVAGGLQVALDLNGNKLPPGIYSSYEIYGPDPDHPGQYKWTCPTDTNQYKRLQHRRAGHTATKLSDGTVLVVGDTTATYTSEIYQPDTDSWTYTSALNWSRLGTSPLSTGVTSTLLDNGWGLVTGGGTDLCELCKPRGLLLPSGVSAPVRRLLPGN
jgi:hypothetical protein